MPDPKHPTCIDTSTISQAPGTSYVCGPGCPRPAGPDPDRDARVDAYRDRERRRAARALDRYIDLMWVPDRAAGDPVAEEAAMRVAGERFVEQVGDYVLARLNRAMPDGFTLEINTDRYPQHNGDYGVVIDAYLAGAPDPCAGGRCPDPEAHAEGAHDL